MTNSTIDRHSLAMFPSTTRWKTAIGLSIGEEETEFNNNTNNHHPYGHGPMNKSRLLINRRMSTPWRIPNEFLTEHYSQENKSQLNRRMSTPWGIQSQGHHDLVTELVSLF